MCGVAERGGWREIGCFTYSGRRFPIGGPLPPFHIDRFLHLHQFYTFIHIHAFYDRTVTAQYVAIVLNLGTMRERAKLVKVANSFTST
jgi:hypothetical protein